MPILRRRGNLASETDMRRHTAGFVAPTTEGVPDLTPQSQLSNNTMLVSQKPSRDSTTCRPDTPPAQKQMSKHRRFSVLRFRNASDSQLSLRAKQQAEKPPPVPRRSRSPSLTTSALIHPAVATDNFLPTCPAPAIITTAPTNDMAGPKKMKSRIGLTAMLRRSTDFPRNDHVSNGSRRESVSRKSLTDDPRRLSLNILEEPQSPRPSTQTTIGSNGTGLNISTDRPSESCRSDVSSTDHIPYSSPNDTTKKSQPSTPFFKLRRTKNFPEPLFPLSHLQQKNNAPVTCSSKTSLAAERNSRPSSAQTAGTCRGENSRSPRPNPAAAPFASGGEIRSGHSSPTRANLLRGRSSTMSSLGRDSTDEHLIPPTSRTSTSTGRKSFGDLLGLTRLRGNSELSRQGSLTPATPGSAASKSNSLQLPRDTLALPARLDDESPNKYIARLKGLVSRGAIAAALSKSTDAFSVAALRSYMRTFSFFGDPMDMAIRKLLMEAELPKETQQIDRCLQAFSNRYHECNPGIYSSSDQAYFIAFSLLILHTDVFNKNNKHKMQKNDYLKNTRGEGIFDEILECFYDNICYTPFIHVEDDPDPSSDRIASGKSRRKLLLPVSAGAPAKRVAKEPIDPYTLIIDGNLNTLRPSLKNVMPLEDQYNYLGSAKSLDLKDLQQTFFNTGVLQIVSARSRPDAFMSDNTANNPDDTHPGIVDIKITKVGLLWRKEAKKRKARSPWQEWGAILTGAQLYFFRNTGWVKNLMHQYEDHIKAGHDGIPITFNPPLEEFKPDALMSTDGAVALLDKSYRKHKNAFVYVRKGGLDEVLLADDESELNDWIAKLNYAAAFRTSGVRIRGVVGGNYDGQGRRGFRRLDSSNAIQLIQTPTGPVSIARSRIDHKMAEDIQTARRDFMRQKIEEADRKMEDSKKALEEQLRNARHLQILAPIQPRTREQLLSAAARRSAQLRWTRMEIWREKCHHDILAQDLKEEDSTLKDASATHEQQPCLEVAGSPTSHPTVMARNEYTAKLEGVSVQNPQTPIDLPLSYPLGLIKSAQGVQTTSMTATPARPQQDLRDVSHPMSDVENIRHESISSTATSLVQSCFAANQSKHVAPRDREDASSSAKSDDIDANERQFLKQVGLLEARKNRDPPDKTTTSTPGEFAENPMSVDRDKFERSKIRRSLQRTLRESAGHLSHHRSRKDREIIATGSSEDSVRDSTLARGAGSFVVHGKKASVIHLGSELQTMSNEGQILARKQQQPPPPPPYGYPSGDKPASPLLNGAQDDDFISVSEIPLVSYELHERRGSAASASTATARSFRELHRKYSTAQAARSVSAVGRLAIPSDGESEAAVSFFDGRRSPLPPIEAGEADECKNTHDHKDANKKSEQEQQEDLQKLEHQAKDSLVADAGSAREPEPLLNRPLQAVNA